MLGAGPADPESPRAHDDGLTGVELIELPVIIDDNSTRQRSIRFERGESQHRDYVGQFDVGLLASFLVADEITVITRSAKASEALRWQGRCDSAGYGGCSPPSTQPWDDRCLPCLPEAGRGGTAVGVNATDRAKAPWAVGATRPSG